LGRRGGRGGLLFLVQLGGNTPTPYPKYAATPPTPTPYPFGEGRGGEEGRQLGGGGGKGNFPSKLPSDSFPFGVGKATPLTPPSCLPFGVRGRGGNTKLPYPKGEGRRRGEGVGKE